MDRMSSIELALKNEETEKDYYLNEAKRSKNPLAKALFETLAEEEREHMTRIRQLHEKLLANGSWPEEVPIEVNGTNVPKVLDGLREGVYAVAEHDADDIEALRRSAGFEEQGAAFYRKLANSCDNPQEAKFFGFLAQIEHEHLTSIKDSLLYFEDPDAWYADQEKSGLDGA